MLHMLIRYKVKKEALAKVRLAVFDFVASLQTIPGVALHKVLLEPDEKSVMHLLAFTDALAQEQSLPLQKSFTDEIGLLCVSKPESVVLSRMA